MAHEQRVRYSELILAKMRKDAVLKDGIVFNNDYEGTPSAGAVKIPVRDTEVAVSNYDKTNGISSATGSTSYQTLTIDKDKGVNEIIDGYDAEAVPASLVADRLDSASYSIALQIDTDGATELLANGTKSNKASIDKSTVYDAVVDVYEAMSTANVPNDGKRYLLVTPKFFALLLKSPEFISASNLGDAVKATGAIGKIAGFNVYEWNDSTVGLQAIAGHPKFATRVKEFSVPVKVQDLGGDGKHIGASAVQGRMVYAHKVLRASAIIAMFAPAALGVTAAAGSTSGQTVLTVTGNTGSLKYRVAPAERAVFGESTASGFTALTSGTTAIAAAAGTIIEVVEVDGSSNVVAAGYVASVPKA